MRLIVAIFCQYCVYRVLRGLIVVALSCSRFGVLMAEIPNSTILHSPIGKPSSRKMSALLGLGLLLFCSYVHVFLVCSPTTPDNSPQSSVNDPSVFATSRSTSYVFFRRILYS